MHDIICPHCGKAFKIDEAGYADILKQVRDSDFDKQLHERLELAEQDKRNAVELAQAKVASESQKAVSAKDAEIQGLRAQLDAIAVAAACSLVLASLTTTIPPSSLPSDARAALPSEMDNPIPQCRKLPYRLVVEQKHSTHLQLQRPPHHQGAVEVRPPAHQVPYVDSHKQICVLILMHKPDNGVYVTERQKHHKTLPQNHPFRRPRRLRYHYPCHLLLHYPPNLLAILRGDLPKHEKQEKWFAGITFKSLELLEILLGAQRELTLKSK